MLADKVWLDRMHEIRTRVTVEHADGGVYFKLNKRKLQPTKPALQATECHSDTDQSTRLTQLITQSNFSYVGSSVVHGDFNGDGKMDIAISAPGQSSSGYWQNGAVYIVYGPIDPFQQIDLSTPGKGCFAGRLAHTVLL